MNEDHDIDNAFADFDVPQRRADKRRMSYSGVIQSDEFDRILVLPRREVDRSIDLTEELKLSTGTMRLRPVQSFALHEARALRGLLAPIGVGHGKGLVSVLLPTVLRSRCAVILTEPQLVTQVQTRDLPLYRQHFNIAENIHVVSYSTLSIVRGSTLLEDLRPDLVVADEAHNLRCRNSVRTRRFLRFFQAHPETRFCALSGTFAARSIVDYEHLSRLALRNGSPLPRDPAELEEWALALDASDAPSPPGELVRLCRPGEPVRSGFRRRLISTPGVVATKESALGVALRGTGRKPVIPKVIQEALKEVRSTWTRPDGEELVDAMRLSVVARQLACGFYTRWNWPERPDEEWLEARKHWHREMRQILKASAPGLDSPLLVASAASQGRISTNHWHPWAQVKGRWQILADGVPVMPANEVPGVVGLEAVWVDHFIVRDSLEWAAENSPAIIWYSDRCMGPCLESTGHLPHFVAGSSGTDALLQELDRANPRTVIINQRAHGTGKNLVPWANQIFTSVSASAQGWEQTLGRTHRPGQTADLVEFTVYQHTAELEAAFKTAVQCAHFIEETKGNKQKLLYMDRVNLPA